jgi:hypothetical protein
MYDIDLNTASLDDVITRSFVCHPTLFRDSMLEVAKIHWAHSSESRDKTSARIALDMASDLRRMADDINMDNFDVESLAFGERIQAFGVACKLQLVPHAVANEIAKRDDASRA